MVFYPALVITNNTVRPKVGTKCKVADDCQLFFVLIERIDGNLITGRIDNIILNKEYKFGDKIVFKIENLII